jgi:AcrR family transcriptional regulator
MAEPSQKGRPRSREARAEATRERLISAAVRHFSKRHYDEVSVSDIAESAGVAHGLLFHHFQTKRGIYLEAMRQAARELDMIGKVQVGLPLDEQLRRLLELHLEYFAKHKGLAQRLILGGRGSDPEAWELFEAGRWRIVEWFCERLGLDSRSGAVRMMMRAGIGAIDEAVVYWLSNGKPYDMASMTAALAELAASALRGVKHLDPTIDISAALTRALQR